MSFKKPKSIEGMGPRARLMEAVQTRQRSCHGRWLSDREEEGAVGGSPPFSVVTYFFTKSWSPQAQKECGLRVGN